MAFITAHDGAYLAPLNVEWLPRARGFPSGFKECFFVFVPFAQRQ